MINRSLLLVFVLTSSFTVLHGQVSETITMPELIHHFNEDRRSLSRFYVVQNSPERRERFRKFYNDYKEKLSKIDFDKLDADSRVDFVLLNRKINHELGSLNIEASELSQATEYVSFGNYIYELEKLRRRGAYLDAQTVAQKLDSIARVAMTLTNSVEKGNPIPIQIAERAARTVRGWKTALKSVNDFYKGYDPDYTWWMSRTLEDLDSVLTIYANTLSKKGARLSNQKDDGSGIIGTPIGNEELLRQLESEMISYTPAELIDIANKEFAWCEKEMKKASNEMGFGNDWKKALEKVKNSYVPEGRQPEMIMQLYNESIGFLKKHDLLTIPPLAEETWDMVMMSPERQLIAPFFLGGETLLIAYPTNTMAHDAKMMSLRGNNPHFSRAVVHHELIAGHRLQVYMMDRYKSYRSFRTPFWMEGWALYWEMILWDKGFPRSPEDKVGMLFWRMHRCARIIFSLNYHLGKWSPQQCIDFLVDRVGHERANAEGEVRRSFTGGYGPLYQLAYMIGALQFYELKKELVEKGNMSLKEFHDRVLRENSMPIEMLRAILRKDLISKDFKSAWRFY